MQNKVRDFWHLRGLKQGTSPEIPQLALEEQVLFGVSCFFKSCFFELWGCGGT